MAENPIKTPLPADLPEDWDIGQTVAPDGTTVGLTEQHGYNYLMKMVNQAQRGVNALGGSIETIGGKRTCRFTVGTSSAGWTKADCDYLCDGVDDQEEINQAMDALPDGGGEVRLLDGEYHISDYISVKKSSVLRGCGDNTKLFRTRITGTSSEMYAFVKMWQYSEIYDLAIGSEIEAPDCAQICCFGGNIVHGINIGAGQVTGPYVGVGIYVQNGMPDENHIEMCNFERVSTAVFLKGQAYNTRITKCSVYDSEYFVDTEEPEDKFSPRVRRLEISGNIAAISIIRIRGGTSSVSGDVMIIGNVLSQVVVENRIPDQTYDRSAGGNIIANNIFSFSDGDSRPAITLGENVIRWFVTGNQIRTSGNAFRAIVDKGQMNDVCFNSDDNESGGGGGAGVTRFNGRSGAVVPGNNDYTAVMVGAIPADQVKAILPVTQAQYDALTAKDAATLYLIKE